MIRVRLRLGRERESAMRTSFAWVVLGLVAFLAPVRAETAVAVRTDREEPVYKCGETATFAIIVTEDGAAVTEGHVTAVLTVNGQRRLSQQIVALGQEPATVSATLEEPGFLLCEASLRANGASRSGRAAAAFEPERMQPAAIMPDDFDAFWAAGRARVDAIPMDLQLTPLPEYSNDRQESFKISLANIDDTRIYGYLSVPKGKQAPYPAIVSVPGVGVGEPSGPNREYAAAGALSLYMGVHMHDLGLPRDEYDKLRAGPLAAYSHIGAPDRERYFFRRAILGIDRAVRYLMSRPDWDGRHLVYNGNSQGGGVGLMLAGLNPAFTAVAVNVPSLCEHNAQRLGRGPNGVQLLVHAPENRKEEYAKMADYFDAVNFARKVRCPVVMSVGFLDGSCPPWTVYPAYNVIPAPKRMFPGYAGGHGMPRSLREFLYPWLQGQLGQADPIPPTSE